MCLYFYLLITLWCSVWVTSVILKAKTAKSARYSECGCSMRKLSDDIHGHGDEGTIPYTQLQP